MLPSLRGFSNRFPAIANFAEQKRCTLDCLYQRIVDDLDQLLRAVGLKMAA
jgi:hypothetical protein